MFKSCITQHHGYVQNNIEATGQHFNLPGHSLADLMVTVLKQVRKSETLYRKEREEYHIKRFDTPGHSLADLMVTVIEQVRKSDTLYRRY